jgi:hypothetical protein
MTRTSTPLLLLLLVSPAVGQDTQTVLLAAHRAGRVEVLDPATLGSIGSIKVLPLADGIESSPGGKFLYIPEGIAPDFKGCCVLYAFDLETAGMTRLAFPSFGAAISPDGSVVLIGGDVYDARTLAKEPPFPPKRVANGVYWLSFSPDGRLLFGLTGWHQRSLDVFNVTARQVVRSYPLPRRKTALGVWAMGGFYLYSYDGSGYRYHGADGQLRKLNLDRPTLGPPIRVSFPDAAPNCEIADVQMLGTAGQLFLYEGFGSKLDRRARCKTAVPGGVLAIDPESGKVLHRLAVGAHFASLVSSPDGKELYGIDVVNPYWDSVSLLRLDAASGSILAKRDLAPDVWFIDLASLPRGLVPRGELLAHN